MICSSVCVCVYATGQQLNAGCDRHETLALVSGGLTMQTAGGVLQYG